MSRKTKKSAKATTRPAPRRGEPKPAPGPFPDVLNTPDFVEAWTEWQRFAGENGLESTPEDSAHQLKLLAKLGPEQAIADIRKTMANHAPKEMIEVCSESTEEHVVRSVEPADIVVNDQSTAAEATPESDETAVVTVPVEPPEVSSAEPVPAPTEAAPDFPETVLMAVVPEPAPVTPKVSNSKLSALDAAAKVLSEAGEPMNCQQLIEAMASKDYWTRPKGKTPAATLYAAILRELKVKPAEARFVKVERGKFAHRAAVCARP